MTRILVTGAGGQLGRTLRGLLSERPDIDARFTGSAELDVTDPAAVEREVCACAPSYIINCAAYTAVDRAEEHEREAYEVNCRAVKNIAEAAQRHGCRVIHVSTDYVFDGEAHSPIPEVAPAAPRTAYGRTKLAGERELLRILPSDSVILRTAWLYSPFGSNFVKTMLRLASEREEVSVVCDQIGTPTSALTLAGAILAVIKAPAWHPGVYHLTDAGAASWYDLAVAVMRLTDSPCRVRPITTADYPTPARRPAYSLLAKEKFTSTFAFTLPHWQDALKICLCSTMK